MKEKLLKTLGLITLAISTILFYSCELGMGRSVDLEAPILEITNPGNMDFVQKTFTIQGTATDNRLIKSVEIEYQYKKKNGETEKVETIKDKKTAKLKELSKTPTEHKVEWSYDFEFDGDYEVEIEVFAYDTLSTGSDDSHQRIMVLIDSEDPNIKSMQITRSNKYVSKLIRLSDFIAPETGRTAKRNKSENKDYFQNENFILSTNLTDNYGIEKVYMELYEVDPETEAESLILGDIAPDSTENLYAPSFTITEEILKNAKPSLASGLHYLKPYVYANDAAGNIKEAKEYKILAWEPEYNKPHVSFNSIRDGLIEVTQGAPIIATIFDDDDLKSYGYTLVKADEFEKDEKTIDDFDPENATNKNRCLTSIS